MDFMSMSERSEEVFLVRVKLKQEREHGFAAPILIYEFILSDQSFLEEEIKDVPDSLFTFIEY